MKKKQSKAPTRPARDKVPAAPRGALPKRKQAPVRTARAGADAKAPEPAKQGSPAAKRPRRKAVAKAQTQESVPGKIKRTKIKTPDSSKSGPKRPSSRGTLKHAQAPVQPDSISAKHPVASENLASVKPEPLKKPQVTVSSNEPEASSAQKPASQAVKAPIASSSVPPPGIPSILLEGDEPAPPPVRVGVAGKAVGQVMASQTQPPVPMRLANAEEAQLPRAHGSGTLVLTARDPHWLYAHWDLPREEQRRYNALSIDGHLVLRAFREGAPTHPAAEVRVHPESQHWFVHVQSAGAKYFCELGYFRPNHEWAAITTSAPAETPPDVMSEDTVAQFAIFGKVPEPEKTMVRQAPAAEPVAAPSEFHPKRELAEKVPAPVVPTRQATPLRSAPELRDVGSVPTTPTPETVVLKEGLKPFTPAATPPAVPDTPVEQVPLSQMPFAAVYEPGEPEPAWTSAQEQRLVRLIYRQRDSGREQPASAEFLHKADEIEEISSAALPKMMPAAKPVPGAGISSQKEEKRKPAPPAGMEEAPGDFWFNINAELVIYGATEPNAEVVIAGRRVRLRPDGTFSYRFSLPDGVFDLDVVAQSPRIDDSRRAHLRFTRNTGYSGEVGKHPQEPGLRPPNPNAIQ